MDETEKLTIKRWTRIAENQIHWKSEWNLPSVKRQPNYADDGDNNDIGNDDDDDDDDGVDDDNDNCF